MAKDVARDKELTVQWRVFFGIGAIVAVMTVIYWFTSYEEAGTVMLVLSVGLAGVAGGYLLWNDKRPAAEAGPAEEVEEYLPHASPWPFAIGVSAYLTANGMILSWAYAVPGAVLMVISLAGFIAQSRRRD